MSERNDQRLREDIGLMFAIYCDENGLTVQESDSLADSIIEEVSFQAGYRSGDA